METNILYLSIPWTLVVISSLNIADTQIFALVVTVFSFEYKKSTLQFGANQGEPTF